MLDLGVQHKVLCEHVKDCICRVLSAHVWSSYCVLADYQLASLIATCLMWDTVIFLWLNKYNAFHASRLAHSCNVSSSLSVIRGAMILLFWELYVYWSLTSGSIHIQNWQTLGSPKVQAVGREGWTLPGAELQPIFHPLLSWQTPDRSKNDEQSFKYPGRASLFDTFHQCLTSVTIEKRQGHRETWSIRILKS